MSRKNTPLAVITIFSLLAILLSFLSFTNFFIPLFLVVIFFILLTAFFFPFWSFLILILLRPLLDIFSQKEILKMGDFSLTATSLLGISALLSLLISLFSKFSKKEYSLKKFPSFLFFPWLLFFLGTFFSLFSSISFSTSLAEIIRLFSIFSMFFLGWFLVDDNTKLKNFFLLIIATSVIPLLVGFWQFFTKKGFQLSFEDVPNRIFGTFAHPNPFAYFLILIAILIIIKVKETNQKYSRFFWSIYFFLILIALFLTYTRGAWLTLILALVILTFFYSRFLLFWGGVCFVFVYLLFNPFQNRINNLFHQSSSSSVNWRMEMWLDGIKIVQKNFVNGTGIGTSKIALLKTRGPYMGSLDPHNDFLRTAIEGGLLLTLAFFVLFSTFLINFWKNFQQKNISFNMRFVNLSFFAITLSLFGASFFDNILSATALNWIFWSLTGAVLRNSK